ncbi:MAG: biopolymer transporter ExbD [Gemmatimonadetes bacterium]|nr:biopolymer transporter ExbD [Gemmatimonadota bacterium]
MSRAREQRQIRRAKQFAKFKVTELNLVPLVDTFVSIVFFALTTTTVGELAPVVPGVTLPQASVGMSALSQLTLGVGGTVTLANRQIMSTAEAAGSASDDPRQPLKIPALYRELKKMSDSIRVSRGLGPNDELKLPLAIQGDKTMRYDLLSRFMATARLAGFRQLSLQVQRTESHTGP